jgi:CRP-like cAMP-binding protein
MNVQYAELITTFPLFQGFTVHGANMLMEAGHVQQYAPGALVVKEGDEPTFVLLVLVGTMQVFVERQGRDVPLKEVGPGTILGELAVLCGIPRSASVRARDQATALHWSADAFRTLLLRDAVLSEQIFRESLKTLLDKERSLIDSVTQTRQS